MSNSITITFYFLNCQLQLLTIKVIVIVIVIEKLLQVGYYRSLDLLIFLLLEIFEFEILTTNYGTPVSHLAKVFTVSFILICVFIAPPRRHLNIENYWNKLFWMGRHWRDNSQACTWVHSTWDQPWSRIDWSPCHIGHLVWTQRHTADKTHHTYNPRC